MESALAVLQLLAWLVVPLAIAAAVVAVRRRWRRARRYAWLALSAIALDVALVLPFGMLAAASVQEAGPKAAASALSEVVVMSMWQFLLIDPFRASFR